MQPYSIQELKNYIIACDRAISEQQMLREVALAQLELIQYPTAPVQLNLF